MELTESLSNLSLTEQINKTDSIVATLKNITVPGEESQFPQELSTIIHIISNINKYLKTHIIIKYDSILNSRDQHEKTLRSTFCASTTCLTIYVDQNN